jgi:hypothetical protein
VRAAIGGGDEALAYLSAGLTEVARDETAVGRTIERATRKRRADGVVALDEEARNELRDQPGDAPPELSVMASGCLGLITFPREPGRVPLERLERRYPMLVPTLRDHPGIGFVLVRSERDGALALGARGTNFLDQGRAQGDDPLAPYGAHAADHVRRTDAFTHCPDLLVNSSYWEEADEVAAFEELVGSHGGMGGGQSHPFVLFPAELDWPEEPVVGAECVHRIFRSWLAGLGHDAYAARQVDSPGLRTRTSEPGATTAT